jgi:hypothetical protein
MLQALAKLWQTRLQLLTAVLLLWLAPGAQAGTKNLTRTICYSGSTVYQQFTQVCQTLDPSYTGKWYCAKTVLCEAYIPDSRECVSTKGCARESECYTTGLASTGALYQGQINLQTPAGNSPAGMTVTPYCCTNPALFPDDDASISWATGTVCNSAARVGSGASFTCLAATLVAIISLLLFHL